MSDIVERLSGLYDEWNSPHSSPDGLPTGANIMLDAADEITSLRAEVERLRAALRDIATGQVTYLPFIQTVARAALGEQHE